MRSQIDTSINNNNRTINGTSAAESQYDDFFHILEGKTIRSFPALSGIQLDYEFAARPSSSYYMAFTPIHVVIVLVRKFAHFFISNRDANIGQTQWCVNGTVSGCAGEIGQSVVDDSFIEACGPLFVSDDAGSTGNTRNGDVVQGIITQVVSSFTQDDCRRFTAD